MSRGQRSEEEEKDGLRALPSGAQGQGADREIYRRRAATEASDV